jgi:ATP-dependent Lhr-like helicase
MHLPNHNSPKAWFSSKGWKVFPFQAECWKAIESGESGLLNAPTGSGKTYAIFLGLLQRIKEQKGKKNHHKGLKILWITPLRALSADIANAMRNAGENLYPKLTVGIRTGDTSTNERAKQKKSPPDVLVTTPESVHLMLASKNYDVLFQSLDAIIVDEWHELLGSKRGVQIELALSKLNSIQKNLLVWGISATIGNMEEAQDVLLGANKGIMIRAAISKKLEICSVLPDEIERFPWSGHLGLHLIEKVLPIINQHKSTLLFTNTRSQAEIWYQHLLEFAPELAGNIALHHGSIANEMRIWVEEALHNGKLKVVVCTSSLDLGVDFRPVENIIQVGSPKGVARFLQRAGRSGHQPDAISKIWFVPTHALELVEASALREAALTNQIEARKPLKMSLDVLVQYLVTLAVSDGFYEDEIFEEIRNTHAFNSITLDIWQWVLEFITNGGKALKAYEDFQKVEQDESGKFLVKNKRTAMRHRLHIGTIVSDPMLQVKFMKGGRLGSIEEWFIAKLNPGDQFWFAGRVLELIHIRDMQVVVKASKAKKAIVPQWMGGRMPLSTQMADLLRKKMHEVALGKDNMDEELKVLTPLFDTQQKISAVPELEEFLIEIFTSRDGYHIFFYPFEGRLVHEGLASIFAYRISKISKITFSIAMNDYGFELLSDKEIPINEAIELGLFSLENLKDDIKAGINSTELARRKFREIGSISGMIFQGYPGKQVNTKNIQSSSRLIFDVFQQYDAGNLLLKQSFDEVFRDQLEESRMRLALERIQKQNLLIKNLEKPSPFAFPIMVDRLRERMSNETIEERVKKMKLQMNI